MHAGRTLSYSMDFKKGQVAAARLFNIIERKPNIDAQEEKGDKPEEVINLCRLAIVSGTEIHSTT
jgi:hypothetical protein